MICICTLLDVGRVLYAASILCTHRIEWLKLNKEKIGYMYQPEEAAFLLQLTTCEILAKILRNHEGSSDLKRGLLHPTAVQYK
jgi:hypothetical protein